MNVRCNSYARTSQNRSTNKHPEILIMSNIHMSAKRSGHEIQQPKARLVCCLRQQQLRARNFYELIINKGEARVNYRLIEIEKESNSLIVLVKTNLCSLFLQNYFKKRGISIVFFENLGLVTLLAATRYLFITGDYR